MGLNRPNGTLKGVTVSVYDNEDEDWRETVAVGWHLSDGDFFIGVGELSDGYGYNTELVISKKALQRFLYRVEG